MVALVTAAIPAMAWAANQNVQAVANHIKQVLESSGKMYHYRVGIKFQNGTVWLRGRVASEEQMETAIRLSFEVPAVERVVNELTVEEKADAGIVKSHNPLRDAPPRTCPPERFYEAQHPEAVPQDYPDEASRVPSSYVPMAAQRTAAEEWQDTPAPRRPRPVDDGQAYPPPRRQRANVAMQQNTHAPSGPIGEPLPMYRGEAVSAGPAAATHDQPCMPNYAWPSYAAYPNYAAVTYPKQYSPTAWPYIGPFYPYPQVPLGWRKVTLEWSDGWWFLDFKDQPASCWKR
jgi:hypothetical protein